MSGVPGVSGDFPVQLAARLPDWSAGGLLRCFTLKFILTWALRFAISLLSYLLSI